MDFTTGYTQICEILYNETYANEAQRYYQLYENNGKVSYPFSLNGENFTLRIHLNFVTYKLHYDVFDNFGTQIITFANLAEAPYNMLFTPYFAGYKMYFSNNKIYLKD